MIKWLHHSHQFFNSNPLLTEEYFGLPQFQHCTTEFYNHLNQESELLLVVSIFVEAVVLHILLIVY